MKGNGSLLVLSALIAAWLLRLALRGGQSGRHPTYTVGGQILSPALITFVLFWLPVAEVIRLWITKGLGDWEWVRYAIFAFGWVGVLYVQLRVSKNPGYPFTPLSILWQRGRHEAVSGVDPEPSLIESFTRIWLRLATFIFVSVSIVAADGLLNHSFWQLGELCESAEIHQLEQFLALLVYLPGAALLFAWILHNHKPPVFAIACTLAPLANLSLVVFHWPPQASECFGIPWWLVFVGKAIVFTGVAALVALSGVLFEHRLKAVGRG